MTTATETTETPAPLDTADPAALALWSAAMDDALEDLGAVVADMLARRRDRKLGPAEHRRLAEEALGALREQVVRAALGARARAHGEA